MASRLEKLMFTVGLIDKASGPASKIAAQFDDISSRATAGMTKVGVGAAGLFATGYALNSLLQPAIEMDRAIGEVRSLGVRESALKQLEKTALSTSIALGENAAEIVRASYDIQSAITGLSDNELSRFTAAGTVLAKGTKSDTATITNYMGTMYGIFQSTASKMGKGQWVEMLAGQTAKAVQLFKTDGVKMAGAFSRLGKSAETSGRSMAEQMAVLGTLQATMSGSEAGTKYSQFLANVTKAQSSLGLQFTDSNDRMLPMVDILNQIKGKFGETLEESEKLQLKKAFGSQQAMDLVTNLIGQTDSLADSITQLGKASGLETATKMAQAIADPWERLDAAGTAVKTTFGRVLQPVLVPLLNTMTDGLDTVMGWTEKFPNLTRVIGMTTLGVMALVATVSGFAIIGGVAQLAMAGLRTMMLVATASTWLFNAALWANPMTWVVGGVIALVAAVALAIKHWDTISAVIQNTIAFQLARLAIQGVIGAFSLLWEGVQMIMHGWGLLFDVLGVTAVFNGVLSIFGLIGDAIVRLGQSIGWIIGKFMAFNDVVAGALKGIADNGLFNSIAGMLGMNVDANVKTAGIVASANGTGVGTGESNSVRVGARDGGLNRESIVPVGGLQQSISNNRGTHIEKLEVNTTGGVNGFQLQDEILLASG